MGVDLKLLPIFSRMRSAIWFSHSVIELSRQSELFEKILEVEKKVGILVPPHFDSYLSREIDLETGFDETHYGITTWTPYGDPVKYVTVKDLLKFRYCNEVFDNFLNRAVWAYLNELPKDTKIALFWS